MGRVKWGGGLSADTFDDAERGQFEPYMGPPVPNGVYCWKIKRLKLGKSSGGHRQLIFGLELTPRRSRPEEKKYSGYYLADYQVVTEGRAGFIAQVLDSLGVSGRDLIERMDTRGEADDRGNMDVAKIGKWVNNGKQYIMAGLVDGANQDGTPRKEIRGYWPIPEEGSSSQADDDDEGEEEEERSTKRTSKKAAPKRRARDEDDDDSDSDSDSDPDEEQEERRPAKKAAKKAAPKRRSRDEDDADEDEGEDDDPPF